MKTIRIDRSKITTGDLWRADDCACVVGQYLLQVGVLPIALLGCGGSDDVDRFIDDVPEEARWLFRRINHEECIADHACDEHPQWTASRSADALFNANDCRWDERAIEAIFREHGYGVEFVGELPPQFLEAESEDKNRT